jgi:hypothetical protein
VAQAVAREAKVDIGRVVDRRGRAIRERGQQRRPRHPEQWPAERAARRGDAGQPMERHSARDLQQERLDLVVAVVRR